MTDRNLTMLTDFYEFTMANGYLKNGLADRIAYFDMFFRRIPDKGGYAIMAGVEQLCNYLNNLTFTDEDIEYLKSKGCFCEEFLEYIRNFKFECDVWAIPEGTPVFPGEPLVTVRGPVMQAQFIETMVLLTINHQSLIATKSSRIVRAANGRAVMEFGSRRAQGADGAVLGARAAYIAGASGTACVLSDRQYGVPAVGTMAHSWVQMFDSEYEAFKAYATVYPDSCVLLVDTYNVLRSGVPNAIKMAKEVLEPMGKRLKGVRIDSGDIAYLSKRTREMLDEAGMQDCMITASNSLDEHLIRDLIAQGACIDSFGIGERLITSKSEPVFGGVYKLVAVEDEPGIITPRIKISENVAKITVPHFKKVYRFYSKKSGKALADYMCLHDETVDDSQTLEIFDPEATWKRKTLRNFTARELQVPIFKEGRLVYKLPGLEEIKAYCAAEVDTLWDEVKRFDNPHRYYVDLSRELWQVRYDLLRAAGQKAEEQEK